jgi:radical SAM protein with 4Fe4S-binding SPASM domain
MTPIPYQQNETSLVALLPDGSVRFLHPSAKPVVDRVNNEAADWHILQDYVLENPVVNLNQFHLSAPAIAFVEITNLCNLTCTHCYAWSGKKRDHEMSTSQLLGVIDQLSEIGVLQVFLTGGEVFTHPDAIEIIRHARSKPFTTQIFTNGLLLDEEKLKSIPAGQSFFISFDTANPKRTVRGRMDYEKLSSCFELMDRYGHVVRTAISVHNQNLEDVDEIFDWCAENGFPRPQWLETHPIGRALLNPDIILPPEKVEKAIAIYRRCMDRFHVSPDYDNSHGTGKWITSNPKSEDDEQDSVAPAEQIRSVQTIKFCQSLERATGQEKCGRSVAYISSNGSVFPCSNCMSNSCYLAGNVKEQDFKTIWETGFAEFRKITFESHEVCNSCEVHKQDIWCQFRCPPLAKNVSKSEDGCGATEYLRIFMLEANKYWQERKQQGFRLSLIARDKA